MTEFLKWTDDGGNEKALEGEFVITEWAPEWDGTLSQFPIEDGSSMSDHYITNPDVLEVSVVVTNQPMFEPVCGLTWEQITLDVPKSKFTPHGLLAVTEAAGAVIGSLLGAAGLDTTKIWVRKVKEGQGRDFVTDFQDALLKIRKGVFACTLTHQGCTLSGMVLTKIRLLRDAESTAGKFKLSFMSAAKAESKSASLPKPASLLAMAPKVKLPLPKPAPGDEAEVREHSKQSLLSGLLGGL